MIQILPKEEKKPFPLEKIFLIFSILIFILSLFYFGSLFFLEKKEKEKLKMFEEKISLLKTEEIQNLEKEILKYQREVSEFSEMIKDYFLPSKLFSFLESKAHPKIFFSKIDVDFPNSKILISGKGEDFVSLHQQYQIFREDPNLDFELKKISLDKEGKIDFEFEIVFKKDIIK